MWVWMYATRIPAMQKSKDLDLGNMRGGVGADLDKILEPKVQWIAHNYNHLLELPTLFYPACILLGIMGMGDGWNLYLAWAFVILRIIHSLVQATTNIIKIRFALFVLSSLCLWALVIHIFMHVFFHH